MKTASISEAKNKLSALLESVRNGETVVIYDRNKPVAKLSPVEPADDEDAWLSDLERRGVIRRGSGEPVEIRLEDIPKLEKPVDLTALIRQERDEGW